MRILAWVVAMSLTIGLFCYLLTAAFRPSVPQGIRELMDECRAEGRTPILDRGADGRVLAMRCPPNRSR